MAIGSRFIDKQGYQSEFLRRVGIRLFSLMTSYVIGEKISDVTSGFRAVGGELLRYFAKIYPVEFPDAAVIITAKTLGFRIIEVPVIMTPRVSGRSFFNFKRKCVYPIKTLISILNSKCKS